MILKQKSSIYVSPVADSDATAVPASTPVAKRLAAQGTQEVREHDAKNTSEPRQQEPLESEKPKLKTDLQSRELLKEETKPEQPPQQRATPLIKKSETEEKLETSPSASQLAPAVTAMSQSVQNCLARASTADLAGMSPGTGPEPVKGTPVPTQPAPTETMPPPKTPEPKAKVAPEPKAKVAPEPSTQVVPEPSKLGNKTQEKEASESEEEDEEEQKRKERLLIAKKEAHARYMRFSRSFSSISTNLLWVIWASN